MPKTKVVYTTYTPTGGVEGRKYFLASNSLYQATNANDTGITPAPEGTKRGNIPLYDTGSLMRAGYLERIKVTLDGGTDKPPVSTRMFCSPDKKLSLLNTLNSASAGSINGKVVLGASSGVARQIYKI